MLINVSYYLPPGSPEGDYNLHHVRVYVRACVRVSRSFLWNYYSYTFLVNHKS